MCWEVGKRLVLQVTTSVKGVACETISAEVVDGESICTSNVPGCTASRPHAGPSVRDPHLHTYRHCTRQLAEVTDTSSLGVARLFVLLCHGFSGSVVRASD